MTGAPISQSVLDSLLEAARWSHSYYNTQSWRFVYAKRDTAKWNEYLDTMIPGNRRWAKDSAALIVVLSNKFQTHKGKKLPVETHSFDAGAATILMSLEGTSRGLVVHPITGFDKAKLRQAIRVPNDDFQIEAIVVVGQRAPNSKEKISQRNPTEKYAAEGTFSENML